MIGNLPYYISTPILFHLIEHANVFSDAVLMLQKEVAARLTANFKPLGFHYVTIDLEGYRQGSMNEVLPRQK